MTRLARLRSFALALGLAATACGGAAVHPGAPAAAAVAATNTSIATAAALPVGGTLELVLPCSGSVYLGPFHFDQAPGKVEIVSHVASTTGAQVCGDGQFVDGDGAQQGMAGLGCAQEHDEVAGHLDYAYDPGAGGSPANPLYLQLGVHEAAPDCASLRVSLLRKQ